MGGDPRPERSLRPSLVVSKSKRLLLPLGVRYLLSHQRLLKLFVHSLAISGDSPAGSRALRDVRLLRIRSMSSSV